MAYIFHDTFTLHGVHSTDAQDAGLDVGQHQHQSVGETVDAGDDCRGRCGYVRRGPVGHGEFGRPRCHEWLREPVDELFPDLFIHDSQCRPTARRVVASTRRDPLALWETARDAADSAAFWKLCEWEALERGVYGFWGAADARSWRWEEKARQCHQSGLGAFSSLFLMD